MRWSKQERAVKQDEPGARCLSPGPAPGQWPRCCLPGRLGFLRPAQREFESGQRGLCSQVGTLLQAPEEGQFLFSSFPKDTPRTWRWKPTSCNKDMAWCELNCMQWPD